MLDGTEPVLDVADLRTMFQTRDGGVYAVNGVSFSIAAGEVLGVVGESGSGKSVAMMSVMDLLPSPPAKIMGGRVLYRGRDVRTMSKAELRALRGGEIGFVFQDPMTSLNPVLTIGFQIMEPLRAHLGLSKAAARVRAAELLRLVGIPEAESRLDDYPHQFSGGMRQRVMIAISLSCDPKVVIADEPTTALDVTIQAQIVELMRELRAKLGTGIIWITHDLDLVAEIADRVMVMYAGQVVEHGPVGRLFADPRHPYTRALLATRPNAEGPRRRRLRVIAGQPPRLSAPPSACPFVPRCRNAFDRCRVENPPRIAVDPGDPAHDVACWWDAGTDLPRVVPPDA
ncbi:ABC transporter ATP-binding protein [Amaricoccus sp. W119]|uniref:ABC transporter ATP-binding protein n=1 Tax=Amaricoccus sp. W119 TaxID=3391833 RepID=UPI0039A54B82